MADMRVYRMIFILGCSFERRMRWKRDPENPRVVQTERGGGGPGCIVWPRLTMLVMKQSRDWRTRTILLARPLVGVTTTWIGSAQIGMSKDGYQAGFWDISRCTRIGIPNSAAPVASIAKTSSRFRIFGMQNSCSSRRPVFHVETRFLTIEVIVLTPSFDVNETGDARMQLSAHADLMDRWWQWLIFT